MQGLGQVWAETVEHLGKSREIAESLTGNTHNIQGTHLHFHIT
uniref:Uncharacterized protein n=1 Tax=Anguilla anguilla TaxID=7936 RepID=A0A0E9VSX3_ANGAN